MKFHTVTTDEPFLRPLQNLLDPIPRLFCIGQIPAQRSKVVSIVGSRKNTSYGEAIAYQLAYDLAKKDIVVASGLAYGIDSCAHRGCLDGGGVTIAVLGTSIDNIYPRRNFRLAEEIIQRGAILSEYAPKAQLGAWSFLERNRIVAGLADAVVVVEAACRSGTLATANFALEQGKELFAVPGDITRPMSVGCNRIIKHGAHVFTETNDILNLIAPERCTSQKRHFRNCNPDEQKILDLLQAGVQDGDEIITTTGLSVADFNQNITMLEINSRVRALGGNKWCII